jgi:hypothetical protein
MIGVFLGSSQTSIFYQQQKQLNQFFPSFGEDSLASQKEINNSGPNVEGAIFPHYLFCEAFTKKYHTKYSNDTHIAHAINMYDIMNVVAKYAPAAKANKSKSILELIKSDNSSHGFCSDFRYKNSLETGGYFDYPTSLYQVKDSKVTTFK